MERRREYDLICKNPRCNEPFEGQLGQLYCNKYCRWDVGNDKKRNVFERINKILRKNHRVLKDHYNPRNPGQTFSPNYLIGKGLNTGYFTSADVDHETHATTYEVYDYSYTMTKGNVITIKKIIQ